MLLQKDKNRSAFVCLKRLNRTSCSKRTHVTLKRINRECCEKQSPPPCDLRMAQYLIDMDLLLVLFLFLQEVLVLLLNDQLGQCVLW